MLPDTQNSSLFVKKQKFAQVQNHFRINLHVFLQCNFNSYFLSKIPLFFKSLDFLKSTIWVHIFSNFLRSSIELVFLKGSKSTFFLLFYKFQTNSLFFNLEFYKFLGGYNCIPSTYKWNKNWGASRPNFCSILQQFEIK